MRSGSLSRVPETTTIRVDRDVHRRLVALSDRTGRQLMDVVRDATDALERAQFAALVSAELDELRKDPDTWAAYVAEADLSLRDGIA